MHASSYKANHLCHCCSNCPPCDSSLPLPYRVHPSLWYQIRHAYLSREERARIVFSRNKLRDLDRTLDRVHREKKILCVNGAELRAALASKPKALVYLFTEGCTSSSCLPLSTIGAYAHKIGAEPYYVAIDLMPGLLRRTEPILSIDYTHYGTKWHDSFYEAFVKDLTGRSTDEEHFDLVLFERGRIVRTFTTEELLQ